MKHYEPGVGFVDAPIKATLEAAAGLDPEQESRADGHRPVDDDERDERRRP